MCNFFLNLSASNFLVNCVPFSGLVTSFGRNVLQNNTENSDRNDSGILFVEDALYGTHAIPAARL